MATNPTFWQEQSPVNSPGELQGEEGMTASPSSPVQNKEAPRATPEEDIDVTEPGPEVKAPEENQTMQVIKTVDVTQMENEKSADISQSAPRETPGQIPKKLSEAFPTEEEPEDDLVEEDFTPPPPFLSNLSGGENCEKEEGFSSSEGEAGEWVSDAEVILDPTEDLVSVQTQKSQEQLRTPEVSEAVYQAIEKRSKLISPVEPNVDSSEVENDTSQQHPPSDDANTVNSPLYADENDEEEEASVDEMSSQPQWNMLDLSCEVVRPSCSATTETEQKEELLSQRQCELSPRREIQEAAQQVCDQGSPPLSAVAMEPPNQGEEASRGSGCVAAVRERLGRVGERTERENKQTGDEEGQKESILGEIKTSEWSGRAELFEYQQTGQTQETQAGKDSSSSSTDSRHTRMKNNMSDNSQSDNGRSEDFSPHGSLEDTTISPGSPAPETPIEREIRRAIEREKSLRRARGLPNPRSSPEYVEIPLRKGLLSQSVTMKWSQNKDREFAGKKMQQEIHEEARREQDLVRSGKVPGVYDKGTVPQIRESKQLFEAFQAPRDSTLLVWAKMKTPSLSSDSTEDLSLESQENVTSRVSTLSNSHQERKPILLNSTQNPNPAKRGSDDSSPRGLSLSKGTRSQINILGNSTTVPAQKQNRVKVEAKAANSANLHRTSGEARQRDGLKLTEQREEDVASKENPFFKLRSSTNLVKVQQDILETKERELELRKMRVSLYGGMNGSASSSKKEQTSPDVPESSAKTGRGSSTAPPSGSRLSAWPPVPAEEAKINQPEVLQSPRTPRQKTPLVQFWESGLVNGYSLEDD